MCRCAPVTPCQVTPMLVFNKQQNDPCCGTESCRKGKGPLAHFCSTKFWKVRDVCTMHADFIHYCASTSSAGSPLAGHRPKFEMKCRMHKGSGGRSQCL